MVVEQNNEQLSLCDDVMQELNDLSPEEACDVAFPTAYKKTEEEQESIEVENSDNEFLKYSQKSESTFVKNDNKLPWILANVDRLYSEKWIDSKYKKLFAQLIFDESGYNRNKYVRKNVVWFLQMTKDKFTNNSDINDGAHAFAQYQNGTRSLDNIANDTASQMKAMVNALENHQEYNDTTKSLDTKPVPVSFWSLKFYQYCGGSKKIDDKVTEVAWKNNIKYENERLWLWLPVDKSNRPTRREAIAAYDRRAANNIT